MRKYMVIMRPRDLKVFSLIEYFNTLDDATEYVEKQRRDDMKNGEADEYEYEITQL